MTWFGQTQSHADADRVEEATTPEPAELPKQMQWLTLLSSVPSSQTLFGDVADLDEEIEGVIDGGQTIFAGLGTPINPLAQGSSEPEIAIDIAASFGERGSGATLQKQMEKQQRAAAAVTMPAPQADKGELIWAAEFVVAEKALEAVEIDESALLAETTPAVKGQKALTRDGSASDKDQQQSGDPGSKGPKDASESRHPGTELAMEVPVLETGPQGTVKVEIKSVQPVADPSGTPAVGTVEPEVARPLRPAQIATLYVDVPAPDGQVDTARMRLAVTQRGDQVNVRLRSWDAGTAPLDNDRMQPLLQSLAEQGYAASKKSIEGVDEGNSTAMEHLKEKPLAAGEAANSDNDRPPFHNGDDRQRKNHERQQQAFLLRRQMQNPNTGQFDLQAQLEGVRNSK